MLTDEQKFENQTQFLKFLSQLNFDITELSKYLNKINYFEAPASTQYTGAYAGGLCELAIKLCYELGRLCNAYFPGRYTDEDIIKVALFKDIYRAEMYETYSKNVKNETTGQWETQLTYRTKESRPFYGDLGFSSYMSVKNYVEFSTEQIEAIVQANGLNNYSVDIYNILKEYPLVSLTKMAEIAVLYLGEERPSVC